MKVEVIKESLMPRKVPTITGTKGRLTGVPDLTVDVLFSRCIPVKEGDFNHKLDYLAWYNIC